MLVLALTLVAPSAFSETHQRDIVCVVEVAVLADSQKRDVAVGGDVQASGKRWAGLVGSRIVEQSGQPRELVAFAMTEAAKARQTKPSDDAGLAICISQMNIELSATDEANAPLPKPIKAQ